MAQELGAMHIGLSIYMRIERSLISFMMGAMDQWEIESQESDMWCLPPNCRNSNQVNQMCWGV